MFAAASPSIPKCAFRNGTASLKLSRGRTSSGNRIVFEPIQNALKPSSTVPVNQGPIPRRHQGTG